MQLKQQAISGVKYSSISTVVTTIVQLLRIVILTRFLEKSDFGLVAIVSLILGFTDLFSDLGFSVALMHKQYVTKSEFSSIFWVNFFVNIFLFCSLCIITPGVARFYSENILNKLIPLLGCQLVISSFGRLYAAQMQKEMKFKFISFRDIVGAVVSLIVAVIAAYNELGVYSLILSGLSNVLVVNLLNFISGFRVMPLVFHFSMLETKGFLKIGLYQTGAQVFDYISNKIDILLIGKLFGTDDLGIYNLSKELVLKPVSLINSIINKVALPVFSNIQSDPLRLKYVYGKVLKSLTSINIPILFAMFIFSNQLVILFYGIKYSDVIPLFQILLIWGLFVGISNPSSSLAIAKGKTDYSFYWTLIRLAINPPVIVIASLISLKGVAIGQVILAALFFFLYWKFIIGKLIVMSFKEYGALIFRPLVISLIDLTLCRILMVHIPINSSLTSLIVYSSVFSINYLLLSWFFNRELFRIFKALKE